jgi:superfamily II DNA or RNA helicase
MLVTITIKNKITIRNLPEKLVVHIKRVLTLENPKYHILKAMGKPVWAKNRWLTYYSVTKDGALVIPRGMLNRLTAFLQANKIKYTIIEDHRIYKKLPFQLPEIELRDYQAKIMQNIKTNKREGILKMTTGTGKTVMAAAITSFYGLYTTIIVPNKVLLEQFKYEFKKFLNYEVGILSGEEKKLKEITVSTYGVLHNKQLLEQLVQQTSVLFIDEVQGCVSPKRKKIIQQFNPAYIYGLTATVMREDGQTEAIKFLAGNIVEEYEGDQMRPRVEIWNTKVNIPIQPEYHAMIDDMINHDGRNTLINYIVMEELSQNRKILVLTKRIEHYKNLETKLPKYGQSDETGIYFMDSDMDQRDTILSGMKTGLIDFKAIFGTTSLLAVGTDIPALDTLIIACDMKSSVLTTQSAGRIMRIFKGKQDPKIIDLHDTYNPILNRQAKQRLKLYYSNNWDVKIIN